MQTSMRGDGTRECDAADDREGCILDQHTFLLLDNTSKQMHVSGFSSVSGARGVYWANYGSTLRRRWLKFEIDFWYDCGLVLE